MKQKLLYTGGFYDRHHIAYKFFYACLLLEVVLSSTVYSQTELSPEEMKLISESLEADKKDQDVKVKNPEASKRARILQSLNPDISLIMDAALAYFSSDDPGQVGGHDPNHTGFTLQQLEMHIQSNVDPFFSFQANIVFALFGVEVEEVYATTSGLPLNLQIRAGQFLTRFGRLNPTHPHTWSFADQPLLSGKFFGGEGSRGLGLEFSWLSPLPWYLEFIGAATEGTGECCARSFYGPENLGIEGPSDLLYTLSVKQFFPFNQDWSLMWGLSAQFGPNPTGQGNRTEIYGTDLYLRYYPVGNQDRMALSLQLEAMFRTRQIPRDVLQDWGLYAQLVWRINQEWELGGRYETVSGLKDDYLDPNWLDHRMRTSAQLTYYPSHFSRLRLQGNYDYRSWLSSHDWGAMLALEVLVGAHGSHAF